MASYVGNVTSGGEDNLVGSTLYGVCSSLSATVEKVVTIPEFDQKLDGVTVHVKFQYTNTAADPTLNINGTGALPIYTDGVNAPGNTPLTSWAANSVVTLTNDITAWRMNDVGAPASTHISTLLNLVYPVGAIYLSTNSTDPGNLFGGTWTQLKDRFLLAAGDSYTANTTGGEESHALTTAELPSHTHTVGAHTHGLNNHTHTVSANTHSHGMNSHTHSIPPLSGTAQNAGSHSHELFTTGGSGETWGYDWTYGSASSSADGVYSSGTHSHSVVTNASNTGGPNNNTTAGNGAFTTNGSTASTAANDSFASGATGSGDAHNNMPPYLVVYAWKRVG